MDKNISVFMAEDLKGIRSLFPARCSSSLIIRPKR